MANYRVARRNYMLVTFKRVIVNLKRLPSVHCENTVFHNTTLELQDQDHSVQDQDRGLVRAPAL